MLNHRLCTCPSLGENILKKFFGQVHIKLLFCSFCLLTVCHEEWIDTATPPGKYNLTLTIIIDIDRLDSKKLKRDT